MPPPVHAFDSENKLFFLQSSHIIGASNEGHILGRNLAKDRQLWWWWPIFDYLYSISFGHVYDYITTN
jgi:hypothetical protein